MRPARPAWWNFPAQIGVIPAGLDCFARARNDGFCWGMAFFTEKIDSANRLGMEECQELHGLRQHDPRVRLAAVGTAT